MLLGLTDYLSNTHDSLSTHAVRVRRQRWRDHLGDPIDRRRSASAHILGGMIADQLRDIAIDAEGNIYVAGGASSSDFPVTPGAYQTTHFDTPSNPAITPYDVVVAKFAPSGQLIWSTFIGGPNYDRAYAIEIAPDGTIFVAGRAGAGFPVTAGAFQTQLLGGQEAAVYVPQDGFVCRLSAGERVAQQARLWERMWAMYQRRQGR
ncbi:MAG: SBBP repeat-containing protein [Phycisphaerae bacterium]|nr:SBBP repeat-containing protein [Phycisphaerae bacterium]